MDKQEIYNYLKEENISYEITNHKAVYNMEEASEIDIPYPNQDAKNLFVRDDKKKNYYLITVKINKRQMTNDGREKKYSIYLLKITFIFSYFVTPPNEPVTLILLSALTLKRPTDSVATVSP